MSANGFNPRTRRACDQAAVATTPEPAKVSIHARVERATTDVNNELDPNDVSIHARVERATSSLTTRHPIAAFQSTHA